MSAICDDRDVEVADKNREAKFSKFLSRACMRLTDCYFDLK